jgi:hypothetical protein
VRVEPTPESGDAAFPAETVTSAPGAKGVTPGAAGVNGSAAGGF